MTKNEFYGAWKLNNHETWNRIYFQEASTFSIRGGNDFEEIHSGKYKVNRDNKEIEFIAFDKDYQDEDIDVLNPDTLRMKSILKMKYVLTSEELTISNDTSSILLSRLK